MRLRTMTVAGALLAAMTAGASAQRMDRGMDMERSEIRTQRTETRTVREPRTTGSVTTDRGASYYAPGQVKRRMNAQSARDYAPGQRMRDDEPMTGSRMNRR